MAVEQSTQDLPAGMERLILAALPPDWRMLGRCRFGTAGPIGEASGCHALAHPAIGIALLDIAPDVTPNAEARLRRALSAADFWPDFPGELPVWHGRIEPEEIRLLPGILAEGFSTLPPLTVPGKAAWVDGAQDAIAEDPAWGVPGRPPRIAAPLVIEADDEEDDAPPPRRIGRLVVAALAVTLGLGLASGVMLLSDSPPEPVSASPAQPPAALATLPEATLPAAAPAEPQPEPQAEPAPPAPPTLPRIERVSLPELPAAAAEMAPPAEASAPPAPPPEPAEVPEAPEEEASAIPLPPPAPKPPPPRRVSAPARPRIDPGCSRALYRFQQGLPLSAAEAAHVRDGCATRR